MIFLAARDKQPLPEKVIAFITTIERQSHALKRQGTAILIECVDGKLAKLLAKNDNTKSLCLHSS